MRSRVLQLLAGDVIAVRRQRFFWISLLGYPGAAVMAGRAPTGVLLALIPVLSYINATFLFEGRSHADRFTASLPVTRSEIVLARYLGSVIVGALSVALLAVLCWGLALASHHRFVPLSWGAAALFGGVAGLTIAFSLASSFALGYAGGRAVRSVATMLLVVVPIFIAVNAGSVSLAQPMATSFAWLARLPDLLPAAALRATVAAGLLLLVGSLPVAVASFARREL